MYVILASIESFVLSSYLSKCKISMRVNRCAWGLVTTKYLGYIHPYISCSEALYVWQVRLQYYKVFEDVKLSAAVYK
jgi:hypothetical protein